MNRTRMEAKNVTVMMKGDEWKSQEIHGTDEMKREQHHGSKDIHGNRNTKITEKLKKEIQK